MRTKILAVSFLSFLSILLAVFYWLKNPCNVYPGWLDFETKSQSCECFGKVVSLLPYISEATNMEHCLGIITSVNKEK